MMGIYILYNVIEKWKDFIRY